jgi:hypothetical protein
METRKCNKMKSARKESVREKLKEKERKRQKDMKSEESIRQRVQNVRPADWTTQPLPQGFILTEHPASVFYCRYYWTVKLCYLVTVHSSEQLTSSL